MTIARIRDALLGLGYLFLVLTVGTGAWLAYDGVFVAADELTLTTGTIGNALQEGSDVKLNGVPVGEVDEVRSRPGGAELTLAMQPGRLEQLPAGTTARLLPKTLFGERYVSLVVPAARGGQLRPGDTISQDTSAEAVELQELFDELLPVLESIEPDKLSAVLGELALLLRDNGDDIGTAMVAWGDYLEKFNPLTAQMADDLGALGRVAEQYAGAAPDLLAALEEMTTTSATLSQRSNQLSRSFATVTAAAGASDAWLTENSQTITVLARESRAALGAVAPYADQFPCLLEAARKFIPQMDRTLGKGTDEPGLHVTVQVVPGVPKYVAGKDDPVYRTGGKPRCPYQTGKTAGPDRPAAAEDEPAAIAPPLPDHQLEAFRTAAGLGDANSPGENQLIAELLAAEAGMAPADYPKWSSLLLGPVLRGTEVTLR